MRSKPGFKLELLRLSGLVGRLGQGKRFQGFRIEIQAAGSTQGLVLAEAVLETGRFQTRISKSQIAYIRVFGPRGVLSAWNFFVMFTA